MIFHIVAVVLLFSAAHAGIIGGAGVDLYAPPKYEFSYGVGDPKTGDQKQQSEVRIGDLVRGQYSLAEPDGTIRVVKYTSDGINGFNAIVERIGKAVHPQQQQLLVQKSVAVPIGTGGVGIGNGLGGGLSLGGLGLGGGLSLGSNGLGGGLGLGGLGLGRGLGLGGNGLGGGLGLGGLGLGRGLGLGKL